jgi:hypothetical protein
MTDKPDPPAETDPAEALEAEVEEVIALCGGDIRSALRAMLIANAYLQAEVDRLTDAVSAGFTRGRIHRSKPEDEQQKAG